MSLSAIPDISEALLQELFAAAPDALVVSDGDGKIVLVNEQTLTAFGYRREELTGREVEILIPRRYRNAHPRQRLEYLADPSTRPMGLWRAVSARHKSGVEVPVEVRLSKISLPSGCYVLAAVRDVSERRRMEAMLQGSNLTLEKIAKGSLYCDVLDAIAAFMEQNNPGIRCAVLRRDECARRLAIEAAPSLSDACRRAISARLQEPAEADWSERAYQGKRVVAVDAGGDLFPSGSRDAAAQQGIRACWSEPIKDSEGRILGTLLALCDEAREPNYLELCRLSLAAHMAGIAIERESRGRQMLEQQAQLRQKQKLEAVGALAGGIAHEFNNLLQVISAYTDFALKSAPAAASIRHDLTTVRAAAKRATLLTRQLLGFCRRQPLARELFDLDSLVAETVELLRPLLGENIRLIVEGAQTAPFVRADASQIQHVLFNLCINARDSMPEGGPLRISTHVIPPATVDSKWNAAGGEGRASVVLAVQDAGIGMTPEVQARVFDPFFTTKEQGRGTGLGLSLAYGIVEQHGGRIEVESAPGKGATFRVMLPAAEDAAKDSAVSKRENGDDASGSGATILVVEDDAAVRGALERVLRQAGFFVLSAESGDDALRLFEAHPEAADLAILDMVMPGRSGRDVAVRMRELRAGFPLILCTGYDPDDALPPDGPLANSPKLVKPVEPERLLRVVRQALRRVQASAVRGSATERRTRR